MKLKCEVPGCTREHTWMKDGKLVCSIHFTPSKTKINIDKGNEAILDDWSDPALRISGVAQQRPFHWNNQLQGITGWRPSDGLKFNEESLKELDEGMKRFTQGIPKVDFKFTEFGIEPVFTPPSNEGVCETFHFENKTYCPEPALRREDVFDGKYLCDKCYQSFLTKYNLNNGENNSVQQ